MYNNTVVGMQTLNFLSKTDWDVSLTDVSFYNTSLFNKGETQRAILAIGDSYIRVPAAHYSNYFSILNQQFNYAKKNIDTLYAG